MHFRNNISTSSNTYLTKNKVAVLEIKKNGLHVESMCSLLLLVIRAYDYLLKPQIPVYLIYELYEYEMLWNIITL